MPSHLPQPARAVVLTISDSRTRGERADLSGPAVAASLQAAGFLVEGPYLLADEQPLIESALRAHAASAPLVVTTGGTGIAPRDVTPEATRAVCTRILDGFAERMRAAGARRTPLAALSRALAGACGRSLIVNLPGSPEGAVTSLQAVLDLIPHALVLLSGADAHTEAPGKPRT
ncbi:MAG TPA: MogA/MoaB family molybdenum cofactor biosynthesis protein [Acidobacteriaceae bacterium]|nr:MogA/MoaB family molybdenum cofactor biosynthesis protein [Acidobacteriaceae bacterium]